MKFEREPAGTGLSLLRDHFAKPLLILMALVVLLLLIACINIASMMLARAAARQHETAVRVSLGAGRIRLIQLALAEALTLSAMGAAAGLLLAWWGAVALLRILQSRRQIVGAPGRIDVQVAPDLHVLLFTAGIALLTGVLFGLTPAWNASVCTPAGALRQTGETIPRAFLGRRRPLGRTRSRLAACVRVCVKRRHWPSSTYRNRDHRERRAVGISYANSSA